MFRNSSPLVIAVVILIAVFVVILAPRGPVGAPELAGLSDTSATTLQAEFVDIVPSVLEARNLSTASALH